MKKNSPNLTIDQADTSFVGDLKIIVGSAREYSYRAANLMQVVSNWLVGWRIVEQEQHGSKRAEYGKHVIELASKTLTEEFGRGYSESAIRNFRRFYLEFKHLQIQQALPADFQHHLEKIQQTLFAESKSQLPTIQQMPFAESETANSNTAEGRREAQQVLDRLGGGVQIGLQTNELALPARETYPGIRSGAHRRIV